MPPLIREAIQPIHKSDFPSATKASQVGRKLTLEGEQLVLTQRLSCVTSKATNSDQRAQWQVRWGGLIREGRFFPCPVSKGRRREKGR